MFLVVSKKFLAVQPEKTACWISAAHFVLGYCGVNKPLGDLIGSYYRPPPAAAGAGAGAATLATSIAAQMAGAGHPRTILKDYAGRTGRVAGKETVSKLTLDQVAARITKSIDADTPVIAAMYSNLPGWIHAVVIVGIDVKGTRVAFKDPAQGDKVFNVECKSFFGKPGFLYLANYLDKSTNTVKDINAYCKFLTTYDERAPAAAIAATAASAAGASTASATGMTAAVAAVAPRFAGHTTPGLGLGGLGPGAGAGIKPP